MSKNWILLTGLLFLAPVGTSQAHPLDSPDIVYIDGLPCNSACQSYLAWSWRRTSPVTGHAAPMESPPEKALDVEAAAGKPALRPAKRAVSRATTAHPGSPKSAKRHVAKQAAPPSPAPLPAAQSPAAEVTTPQPASEAAVKSEPAPINVAAVPAAAGAAAVSKARTVQEQVAAATNLAVQVTAARAPHQEAAEASIFAEAAGPADSNAAASAATEGTDKKVVLVMVLPEIKSVSDLAGKNVAIEDQQAASGASIRAAIAAAGAADVQLNEKNEKAVDRLVGGEVPAAVVALVSKEAAEWFPDIPGYRIFRIPLSTGS
jgi:hypothetical protein